GFMGSPRMNLVKAQLVQADGGLALDFGQGARMALPALAVSSALAAYAGREVIAGIRPEAVALAAPGMVAGPLQCFMEAKVEVIEPTGADTLVLVDLGGHEFTVRLEPDIALTPGQQLRFLVDLAKLVCFDPQTEALIA